MIDAQGYCSNHLQIQKSYKKMVTTHYDKHALDSHHD